MLNSIYLIRELVNCAMVVLSANLAVVIAIFLLASWADHGDDTTLLHSGWTKHPGIATACALWWIFSAESVRAFAAGYSLHVGIVAPQHMRPMVPFSYALEVFYLIAGIILAFTMLRCTYLFTPPAWGHKAWVVSALETTLVLIVIMFLKSYGH